MSKDVSRDATLAPGYREWQSSRGLNVEQVQIIKFAPDVITHLNSTVKAILPKEISEKWKGLSLSADTLPGFTASEITSKTPEQRKSTEKSGTMVVFLSGMMGSGAGVAPIAADIYTACQESTKLMKNKEVGVVLGIGSSVSYDTLNAPMPDMLSRAAMQAAMIAQRMEVHQASNVILIGHSNGGQEAAYIAPMLQSLLSEKAAEVSGVVFAGSGGQYDQSPAGGAVRFGSSSARMSAEIEELFPSVQTIHELNDRVDRATEKQDAFEVHRLKTKLQELSKEAKTMPESLLALEQMWEHKAATLPTEDPESTRLHSKVQTLQQAMQNVRTIDAEMENAYYANDKKLLKKLNGRRQKILYPYVKQLLEYSDLRGGELPPKIITRILAMRTNFGMIPEWLRDTLTMPVVQFWGEKDATFQPKNAHETLIGYASNRRRRESAKNVGDGVVREGMGRPPGPSHLVDVFRTSPMRVWAVADQWPHISPGANSKRFGTMMSSLVRRMLEHSQQTPTPKSDEYVYF